MESHGQSCCSSRTWVALLRILWVLVAVLACVRSVLVIIDTHSNASISHARARDADFPMLELLSDAGRVGQKQREGASADEEENSGTGSSWGVVEAGDDSLRGGVCSSLPQLTQTAALIWSSNQADVFRSTQHPLDKEWTFHDFTAHLLHFMTADRLQRSIDTPPHDFDHVGRILYVAYKRWAYVREHTKVEGYKPLEDDPEAPPRLRILVMGGSVAMGVLCTSNPVTKEDLGRYSRRVCAWPARLEAFLNNVLKADVVRVTPITLGGTNTESGITIWKYGLFPEGLNGHPHILINAYATNDVHVNSIQAAHARNETLHSSVWSLTQEFIRTVKAGCNPPLLIYLNDYIGNEQNEIMQTNLLSRTIHQLSTYYGTMAISYADAVRDLVYADTAEEWFSPHAWFGNDRNGEWFRQIHPGMGMHISATWVVAYNLLHLATTFCGLPSTDAQSGEGGKRKNRRDIEEDLKKGKEWDYDYRSIHGLPELRGGKYVARGPRPKPDGLPPVLTDDLKLEHVSQIWIEEAKKAPVIAPETTCASKPCIYSWICGLEKDLNKPTALNNKVKPYLTVNNGWEADKDNNKLGFVPKKGKGSKFTMEFTKLTQPVTRAVFMVMKSYGEKWEGSMIKADAFIQEGGQGNNERLANGMQISGQHGKSTSETYNYEIDLTSDGRGGAVIGDSLKVTVELVGGTTFKFTGMAFCHQ